MPTAFNFAAAHAFGFGSGVNYRLGHFFDMRNITFAHPGVFAFPVADNFWQRRIRGQFTHHTARGSGANV
jgi:hypothetical protein